ncbi:ABC transporter substrate-binding protein [Paenibacillus prosopidis]|uniref:Thiamine pyrimidine synthase n=1 Tax=Paenibacillus prosopidis TaxID=630520 RepID=A0A368VSA1_9BACL|nr:ABC transporter substrate-binding protein [Paenibacillus prosopidis]RCW43347.1 NitT/TauT family transport system substrate-binding protein [Paenibacillus prosopidis]
MTKRSRMLQSVSTILLVLALLVVSACGNNREPAASTNEPATAVDASPEADKPAAEPLKKVKIQLKWVPQAQFAGIFVAKEKGFYEEEGLDVEIIPGGPDVVIEQQVVNGAADIGVTSFDSLLVNRDNGLPLVSVAQVLQKSSYRFVASKESGIDSPAKMKGKKIGMWTGSQQFQVLAFMEKNGLDPKKDVELVKQGFTMDQFFNKQLDVAVSTIYNEYHVVLESGIKEEDLYVYDFEDAGVGMLEDTLIVKDEWLKNNRDIAVKAIKATMKGWNYAIANQAESVDIVMSAVTEGSTTKEHQTTMLMEMAKLVKPEGFTDAQVGSFVDDAVQRTVEIAVKYGLIKKEPDLASAIDKTILEDAAK